MRIAPVRMIALVNDSGVDKTSPVCSFAESLRHVLPVGLVQARDLAFGSEDALVARVIHALQGVLEPSVHIGEKAALMRHLAVVPLALEQLFRLQSSPIFQAVGRHDSHLLLGH